MQLSKSEYMMYLRHPAWLWLKKHDKSKLPAPDANLQAIFDAGIDFEKYANKKFPDGTKIGFDNYSEYLSMPERTKKALDDGANTIFQGRFEAGNITCICDVVDQVDSTTLDLYEIKSSTKVKPEHIPDLAFQTIVLENAGFSVRKVFVIHVNNEYVRDGDIDYGKLSSISDVTDNVRDIIEKTKYNILLAIDVTNLPTIPNISPALAKLGSFRDWMEIYKNLKKVDPYSIYNLIAPGVKRIGELEDMGVELIRDIPDDFKLTSKQQVQVMATKQDERIIDREKIKTFFDDLVYPLYFLDYETAMSTIPLYDGTRPYQQIPFQYSLHIIEGPEEKLKNVEYLHRDNSNPLPNLLKKLKEDIGPVGSVFVWFKNFEMKRNEEMAAMFPEFKEFLEDVNRRVIDLIEPFSNGWFVDKDFFGGASIKYVLPVVVPDLSYKELSIQEGASAQRLWMDAVLRNKDGIDKDKLFSDLVEYCKMDTLAMVEIWRYLNNLLTM